MRKSFIFLIIIGFIVGLSVLAAHAQDLSAGNGNQSSVDQPSGEEPRAESSEAAPAASDTAAQAEKKAPQSQPETKQGTVTAIEVQGNKSVSVTAVVSKMKTKVGSPYQDTIISDDLKRLYLLGYFSDIKIDTQEYKDGLKVIVRVVERPIVEKITFSGLRHITLKDNKLKEKLKTKETQYLDYPNLAEDVKTIKAMYEKIGFSNAQVSDHVSLDGTTNKATVQFDAIEGNKSTIKDIYVRGNKSFPAKRILRLMKTKSAWLFNRGVLKEEVLKEDADRVRAFYRKEGYSDVVVNYEVKPYAPQSPLLYITVTIEEGKKYLVGAVAVQGNKDLDTQDILAKLKECVAGKVFSQEALKADLASIQSLYFDRGYISAQVQEATSVNPATGRVDIRYTIVEHSITYVDKIKIRGNIKTRDTVIRRELRIHPGDKFDGDKLKRSRERLQNLGFFEEIGYDVEDSDTPEKKNLLVDVKESKTGSFSFGGGYSTVDQLVGFVEVEQKNFDWANFPYFTGGGQNLKIRASFGSLTHGYDLSFTEPWIFDYPVSFGFDVYQNEHKRESDVGYGYDEKVTGGDLRLGKELSEYVKGNLVYRYDIIKITNITEDATEGLKREEGENTISSITPGLVYDSRDNVFDTRTGDYLSGSLQLAGGPLSGDKDFWKFLGGASHFFPLPRQSALEVRGRFGLVDKYGDSDRVPIYERLFAGGASTVRGYDERIVGPIDPVSKDPLGGNSMLVGNIEYTYPLLSFLKVAAFYDIGNVWPKVSDIGSGGMKSAFGFGFRVKTPVGPINLDYGIPLDKAPGEDSRSSGKLHFSASHGF